MAAAGAVPPTVVARAPKALLHDHLDGGLRPATGVDLAGGMGHDLPTREAGEPAHWCVESEG